MMSETKSSKDISAGPWQRQFDAAYDFPTTPVTTKVAFCTTPRCGSHFLGHRLHGTGAFGYPLEYLNPGNWHVWEKRAGPTPPLDYIKSVRTGPNGVFSVKLHHEHLAAFLKQEVAPLDYKFIHLQRRDLMKQAISFARAQQTGAWISDMPEKAAGSYDWSLITDKMDAISRGNADWQSFLSSMGIQPLQLYYEDVVADASAAIAQIADYLGVAMDSVVTTATTFTPQQQKKTAQAADWLSRYQSDSRAALAQGRSVAGFSHPTNATIWRGRTTRVAKKLRQKAGL
ncbi:Stf0 family sulfotransferase [Roseobacter sp. CCS2]|uniref:Stf0 family sulfotransferase n=1 Tax=Roseobacter sp. CCS2 TaxID=391593 RepID=UPI0000F3C756|nr:Stf0 family sulfotransferase [Roseobacter sp. CCS2]EBA11541.1 hypothetical protein RCCS2_16471 [Roseobacter sp. CCS2]